MVPKEMGENENEEKPLSVAMQRCRDPGANKVDLFIEQEVHEKHQLARE
ncbi:hypothetical protein ACP4OV_010121 [Aristida adscensionis]